MYVHKRSYIYSCLFHKKSIISIQKGKIVSLIIMVLRDFVMLLEMFWNTFRSQTKCICISKNYILLYKKKVRLKIVGKYKALKCNVCGDINRIEFSTSNSSTKILLIIEVCFISFKMNSDTQIFSELSRKYRITHIELKVYFSFYTNIYILLLKNISSWALACGRAQSIFTN